MAHPIVHFQVVDGSPVAPCEVYDLQAVTVICGRNNSGKSTLLQALASDEMVRRGVSSTSTLAKHVAKRSEPAMGWSSRGTDSVESNEYRSIINGVIASKRVWFDGTGEEFATTVRELSNSSFSLKQYHFNLGAVAEAYRSTFQTSVRRVLIPARRSLELVKLIALSEEPQPEGAGILNSLFYLKSQPVGSGERNRYDAIMKAFQEISSGYIFDLVPQKANTVTLNFSKRGGDWRGAESFGLGLQDLLILVFFALEPAVDVLLIEEPESHLHPEMQRKLLSFFRAHEAKQYFITTHSNVFLDNALVDRVLFTAFDTRVRVSDETSRASILDDLGYSVADNLVSDVIILVEGPTDVPVIEEFLSKLGLYQKYDIRLWPLGGDIMDQVDLSVFAQRYKVIALVDQDAKSSKVRRRFVDRCKEQNIDVTRLKRNSIENYFTMDAIRSVLGSQVKADIVTLDPAISVDKQLGISPKRNNRKIARAMSLSDFEGTDLADFLKRVGEICRSPQ
jgi:5S rRNA maturation endonuclease (ribonuclease M5)